MLIRFLLFTATTLAFAQMPGIDAQKAAMKKLSFLAGKWSGDATVHRGPGEPLKIRQSEDIRYRFDRTILLIEGTGTDPDTGKVVFNAFAVVSYNDVKKEYRNPRVQRRTPGGRPDGSD